MTIKVRAEAGALFPVDLAFLFDFAALGVDYDSIKSGSFSGSGSYFGFNVTVKGTGSGFSDDLTSGKLDKLVFDLLPGQSGGKITFSNIDLTMGKIGNAIEREFNGNANALEKFLMKQGFNVVFDGEAQLGSKNIEDFPALKFNLSGKDIVRLKGGDDVFFLGDGADRGYGDGGSDTLEGGKGNDQIFGGKGADKLYGQSGKDKLFGGGGDDDLFGGSGADRLVGGRGKDDLKGGRGDDVFVFKTGHGKDTIKDFAENNNREDIDLSGVKAITGFKDLKKNHMEQDGSSVVIRDNDGLRIEVLNADLADMNQKDFIF